MKLRSILGATVALGAMSLAVGPAVAGAAPVKSPSTVSDHVSFAGLIIGNLNTGAFHVSATSCTLTSADDPGSFACTLTGSGTGSTGTIHVTSADGTITTSVALCGCGQLSGTGTERDFDNGIASPIAASGFLTSRTPTASPIIDRVTGFFDVFETGQVNG
jgi:hypothetical protein